MKTRRFVLGYTAIVGLSILAIGTLLRLGSWLAGAPPAGPAIRPEAAASAAGGIDRLHEPFATLLVQVIAVIVAANACGRLARRVGQPAVIGELAAGILLGPSLLGWLAPGVSAFLFPPASLTMLNVLSQLGVLLFMFVVGIELDASHLRARAHAAVVVSHISIVLPFLLGVGTALLLYRGYAPAGVPFHAFALFLGTAMSITAFPVLARIIDERRLSNTHAGATALACAAVDDVTAWTLLAVVVAVSTSGGALAILFSTLGWSLAFVVAMVYIVRPVLARLLPDDAAARADRLALVLAIALAAALATEVIGIHGLFGAFVAGAIMPVGERTSRVLRERLGSLTSAFLLPLFFAYTGLRTRIGVLDSAALWGLCLLVVAVATVGKLGGTVLAARWTGFAWREAVTLGALMNTRGLMELVALNVGYDLGILSPEIFAMMVLMALVTTAMAGPIVGWSAARPETVNSQRPTPNAQSPPA